jgi:hypothetical protein
MPVQPTPSCDGNLSNLAHFGRGCPDIRRHDVTPLRATINLRPRGECHRQSRAASVAAGRELQHAADLPRQRTNEPPPSGVRKWRYAAKRSDTNRGLTRDQESTRLGNKNAGINRGAIVSVSITPHITATIFITSRSPETEDAERFSERWLPGRKVVAYSSFWGENDEIPSASR